MARIRETDTLEGWAIRAWYNINTRTVNGMCPQWQQPMIASYLNKGILLEFTREELIQWALSKRETYNQLKMNKEIPSVDRIDPSKNYSIDNIRMISRKMNRLLGSLQAGEVKRKKMRAILMDGTIEIYGSQKEAAKILSCSQGNISRALKFNRTCAERKWEVCNG